MRRVLWLSCLLACTQGRPETQTPPPPVEIAGPSAPTSAPAPASEPTPAPTPTPTLPGRLPIGSGVLGTAAPTLIRAMDRYERWVALCQARRDTNGDGKLAIEIGHHGNVEGDAMELYLMLGGGEGTRIDAVVGYSPDRRWLAIVRDGKVELIDSTTGEIFALRDADARADARPGTAHRAGVFAGQRLLYIRQRGDAEVLVIHDLADHSERELPVPGRLWRIGGGADRVARLFLIPRDQPFPVLNTTLAGGECVGPAASWSSYGDEGPRPRELWIDVETGAKIHAPHGQVAVGKTIIRTPPDGSLYFGRKQIAPPSCRAHLLAVLPDPVRVIAICGAKKAGKVLLLGPRLRVVLEEIDREDNDHWDLTDALSPASGVICDRGLHCVATATNTPIDLKDGVAEYAWGDRVYVVHAEIGSRTHEIVDVAAGTRIPSPAGDLKMMDEKFAIDYRGRIIDLESATVVGQVDDAVALSAKGRALVAAGELTGPLRWVGP